MDFKLKKLTEITNTPIRKKIKTHDVEIENCVIVEDSEILDLDIPDFLKKIKKETVEKEENKAIKYAEIQKEQLEIENCVLVEDSEILDMDIPEHLNLSVEDSEDVYLDVKSIVFK